MQFRNTLDKLLCGQQTHTCRLVKPDQHIYLPCVGALTTTNGYLTYGVGQTRSVQLVNGKPGIWYRFDEHDVLHMITRGSKSVEEMKQAGYREAKIKIDELHIYHVQDVPVAALRREGLPVAPDATDAEVRDAWKRRWKLEHKRFGTWEENPSVVGISFHMIAGDGDE